MDGLYEAGTITTEEYLQKKRMIQKDKPYDLEIEEENYYHTHTSDKAYNYLKTLCVIFIALVTIVCGLIVINGMVLLFTGDYDAERNSGLLKMIGGSIGIYLSFFPFQILKFVKRHYDVVENQNEELYQVLNRYLKC